ncbi:hypothetical protein SASPL_125751 [Salvia splendens]|uniref:Disease resistance protein RPS2 n=1 Tax=Salvia splendens TaxID=180675 RepID=A0A8X8ZQ52_SALSN|nr:hypothetical protein SASPL_125751 [Salvia splendens]
MGVQYLVNLRYLVITYLPPSIGRLTNLETQEEVHLPPAVMKMLKLRCIHVNTEAIYDKHCSSSERNNIESLSCVRISRFEHQEMLKSSPHLRRLKCWYAFRSPLPRTPRLAHAWETRDGEFQQLRFLKLDRISISEWKVKSSEHFPKLQNLVLSYCPNLEEIPSEIGEIGPLVTIEVRGQCLVSLVESARIIHQEQLEIGNDDLCLVVSTY